MRKRTRILSVLAAIVAVAISGGTVVNAATDSDSPVSESTKQVPTDRDGTPVSIVQDEILDNFALFRNQAATPMPPDVAVQVGSPARYGRNPALARTIETPFGTGWVTPGDGYLCIAVPDPTGGYGSSCIPTELAIERGLALRLGGIGAQGKTFDTAAREGGSLDTIIVPDGAKAVAGSKTLPMNANGVVTHLVRDGAGPMPTLVPAG